MSDAPRGVTAAPAGDQPAVAAVTALTCAGARRVLDAAYARATELGVPVNVAVCDRGGELIAFARMDGAALLSSELARDKAWSVTAFNGLPTAAWFDLIRDQPALREGIVQRSRLVVFGGGVPVLVGGELVGAIGVSGGSEKEDEDIAAAGAAAVS